jgi:molybdopterin synthase catalytic subunit
MSSVDSSSKLSRTGDPIGDEGMKDIRTTITSKPISVDAALKSVSSKSAGGTVMFIGTVRDRSEGMRVIGMELESARDLAKSDMERISNLALRKFDVLKVAVSHRIGELNVGDIIVAIAVSAPHRKDAFAACKYIIDELKKTTPIWKKELGPRKQRWVESKR